MSTAPEHAFKEASTKLLILPPLRTIYFRTFQCETHCKERVNHTLWGITKNSLHNEGVYKCVNSTPIFFDSNYLLKGGFFSERADAFVISPNRRT